jgi:RHS repeat-associated protein
VAALINTAGSIVGIYDYDAFENITYAGYQYDKETDLYYLNARYYDAKMGMAM